MSINKLDKIQLKIKARKHINTFGSKNFAGKKKQVFSVSDKESKDVLNDTGQIDFDELNEKLEDLLNSISFNIMV